MNFPNASDSFKKLNPHLFSMARLRAKESEPGKRGQGEDRRVEEGEESIRYRIGIAMFRKRLLDRHDNARTACKPLVDIITKSLGFQSDDCPELEWEYIQIKSDYAVGTHVLISQSTLRDENHQKQVV